MAKKTYLTHLTLRWFLFQESDDGGKDSDKEESEKEASDKEESDKEKSGSGSGSE